MAQAAAGGCPPPGGDALPLPMMLALWPDEIFSPRSAIEGYLALDIGGWDHHILEELHSQFAAWERRLR